MATFDEWLYNEYLTGRLPKTMHTDSLDCECQIISANPRRKYFCQYASCTHRDPVNTTPSTDGIYMHEGCWREYDREWKRIHPESHETIVDSGTQRAEQLAGA